MNELGIAVDVSHSGHRTSMDAIEASSKPILFSHTNCKAIYDHPRNKSDEAIKALAKKGGVMGMTLLSWFISENSPSTFDDLLEHFDHVIRLVGPDHVGIGSDMGLPGWRVTKPDQTSLQGSPPQLATCERAAPRYRRVAVRRQRRNKT